MEEAYTMNGVAVGGPDPQPPAVMNHLRGQATSFNAECRVYGRLKELGKEKLAVKAHGYLKVVLTRDFQEQWETAVVTRYADGQHRLYWIREKRSAAKVLEMEDNPDQPVYAIVKDYIPDHRDTDGDPTREREMKKRQIRHIPQMLRNLHQLHKCGIVVRDLKEQQYFEGQIVDFSHAWTVPHITAPGNDLRPDWAWKSMAAWDLYCFQVYIINHWNRRARDHRPVLRQTRTEAWRNGGHHYNLRSSIGEPLGPYLPLCKYDITADYDMKCDPPFDPSEFNWRGLEQTKREKHIVTGRVKKRTGRTGPRRRRGRRAAQANAGQADGGQDGGAQVDAGDADPGDVLM